MKQIIVFFAIAALLWGLMFSPWTAPHLNFWLCMSISGALLVTLSIWKGGVQALSKGNRSPQETQGFLQEFSFSSVGIGIVSAAALWGIFWLGNYLSTRWFDFAQTQISSIYAMKDESNQVFIAVLLLFLIGPAEEIFWRGYIQTRLSKALSGKAKQWAPFVGLLLASCLYALVHIWSFNFILIMAALVCGLFWGLLYLLDGRLSTVIVSHAIWDVAVFIVFPI